VEAARCELAADFPDDMTAGSIPGSGDPTKKKLAVTIAASGTSLTGAVRRRPGRRRAVIGDVREVSRSPGRTTSPLRRTAPIEVVVSLPDRAKSAGEPARGKKAAQPRHSTWGPRSPPDRPRHSQGRACTTRKLAEGKTTKEALRSLKRQSERIFACCRPMPAGRMARVQGHGRQQGGRRLCRQRGRLAPRNGSGQATPGPVVSTCRPVQANHRWSAQVAGAEPAFPGRAPLPSRTPPGQASAPAAKRDRNEMEVPPETAEHGTRNANGQGPLLKASARGTLTQTEKDRRELLDTKGFRSVVRPERREAIVKVAAATVLLTVMEEGPPGSPCRRGAQTTATCAVKSRWWW